MLKFADRESAQTALTAAINAAHPNQQTEFPSPTIVQIGDDFAAIVDDQIKLAGETSGDTAKSIAYWRSEAKREARKTAIKAAIAAAIGTRGAVNEAGNLTVDSETYWNVSVTEDRDRSSYLSRASGKFSVSVGPYGNKRRFPERKDGSHDYGKIAALILADINRRAAEAVARAKTEAAKKANAEAVTAEFLESLGVLRWSASVSADQERPVRVDYRITRNLTIEQARALASLLASF